MNKSVKTIQLESWLKCVNFHFCTQIVGDQKYTINETVHVQQSDFGHVIFKVRTVDVKPVESTDETTEGVYIDTTISPDVDDTQRPTENDDDDERPTVEDTGDIDGNGVDEPELIYSNNEILQNNLEHFGVKK